MAGHGQETGVDVDPFEGTIFPPLLCWAGTNTNAFTLLATIFTLLSAAALGGVFMAIGITTCELCALLG